MSADAAWTCPFCALLCDRYGVERASPLRLRGSDCPRANDALRHFDAAAPMAATPLIDAAPASFDAAIDAAARLLRAARQPLIGGLASDVAGIRALYRLAAATAAIVDHAHGESMQHPLRALQDRGQFTATLAELHERAETIVCVGTRPGDAFPEFWKRVGAGRAGGPLQRAVFVGVASDARLASGVASETIDAGDLPGALSMLNALVAGRPVREPPPALAALAKDLLASRYSALVWEPRVLDRHGALVAESLHRLVDQLNRSTRAAALALGGNDGAATAQQVVTWLSGLPLRTRVSRERLDHEPLRFGTARLLDDGAADALLWVASFGPQLPPPHTTLPLVVLGHPALAAACRSTRSVFVPVSTPGIGSDGHLFRLDGVVALPTPRLYDDGLPSVAFVADALTQALR